MRKLTAVVVLACFKIAGAPVTVQAQSTRVPDHAQALASEEPCRSSRSTEASEISRSHFHDSYYTAYRGSRMLLSSNYAFLLGEVGMEQEPPQRGQM